MVNPGSSSSSSSVLVLSIRHTSPAADHCAELLGAQSGVVEVHDFPDGEIKLRLPECMPRTVVLWQTLNDPNRKLIELLLAARTARGLGAERLLLVAPYLAYMRQDIAFVPGEAVSQRIIGQFLASLFDGVITVDPHLHRVSTLEEATPVRYAIALSGARLLADWIASRVKEPVLVGPDAESHQWVHQAADEKGWEAWVCHKVRSGDRQVEVALPDGLDPAGRSIVLMDDVASTGRTLISAASQLLARGAASVDVAVTHALFAGDALTQLHQAGIRHVWSTDCIEHESNCCSVAPMVAQCLRPLVHPDDVVTTTQ